MDDKRIDKAAAFDTLFTSNRIQILKILAYYMDPRLLKGLAVYIKMSELQYTLTLFRRHPETSLCIAPSSANEETATELCNDLMPLCDETQKSALRQITQMMDNIHNFQEMMEMVQTMQELFPGGLLRSLRHGSVYVVRSFFHCKIRHRRSEKWTIPRHPSGCRMIS